MGMFNLKLVFYALMKFLTKTAVRYDEWKHAIMLLKQKVASVSPSFIRFPKNKNKNHSETQGWEYICMRSKPKHPVMPLYGSKPLENYSIFAHTNNPSLS